MKRIVFVVLVFSLIFIGCKQKKSNEVEIGAILPLTGYFSFNGQCCKEGLDLAVQEINNSQSKYKFTIIYEDNHSLTKDGIMSYKKFHTQNIKYILGFGGQLQSGFISETNNQDLILFAHAANNTEFLSLSNRCLRFYPTTEIFAQIITNFWEKSSITNVGIVYLQNDAFTKLGEAVRSEFVAKGYKVSLFEGYDPNSRDYKDIVNKAANKDIQCIYIAGSSETAASFVHQLFSNPKTDNIAIIGEMSLASSSNRELIGEIKAPIYLVDNNISDSFLEKYKNTYNKTPNAYAAYAYANMYMLLEALDNVADISDAKSVYRYFRNNTFETVIGSVSFDNKTGEPNFELIINELK